MNSINDKNAPSSLHYLLYLISISICFVLFLIYVLVKRAGMNTTEAEALAEFVLQIIPNLFSALLIFISLYFFIHKRGLKIEAAYDKMAYQELQKVEQQLGYIKEDVIVLREQSHISHQLYAIVNRQKNKIVHLLSTAHASTSFVGRYYVNMMHSYHEFYKITKDGFSINKESLSLLVYTNFWEYLLKWQKKHRNRENGLVVKIIHSNSVKLWMQNHDKYNTFATQTLRLQKEFIAAGGSIIRFFIGREQKANQDYLEVMKSMSKIGIKTGYRQKDEYCQLNYGFLFLESEGLVIKWHSDATGDYLARMDVHNKLDQEVKDKWRELVENFQPFSFSVN